MKLIVKEDARSPISEAYRILRTNIQFSTLDNETNVLAITSAGMAEGKSTTVANLASVIAQNGQKVLIIDCDMRRPEVHKLFELSNVNGFSNYLIREAELAEVIVPVEANLHILPSGTIPNNPSELLSSQRMKDFLEEIKEQYDYVLIDTPPVMVVADAQVVSTMCNGVIMVVASSKAQKEMVNRAKECLEIIGAKIIGVVLTCTDRKSEAGYYYEHATEKLGKKVGLSAIFRRQVRAYH